MPPAQLFDFRHPLPMPAGATRLVTALTEASPRVGLLLGMACGRAVTVVCPGVRRVAVMEVATPGAVWMPLATGLPEAGLLLVSREAATALADLYLGGTGLGEDRPTTPLEQSLLVRHTLPALRPLAQALADHGVRGLDAGPLSEDPLPAGGGEVLAVPLDATLPSGSTVRITVCLPAKSLLPSDTGTPVPAMTEAAAAALADVPLEVALRLPSSMMSARDVEDLRPGDVLQLAPDAPEELVGVLAGELVPVFHAALGRRDDRRAVVVRSLTAGGS